MSWRARALPPPYPTTLPPSHPTDTGSVRFARRNVYIVYRVYYTVHDNNRRYYVPGVAILCGRRPSAVYACTRRTVEHRTRVFYNTNYNIHIERVRI